MPLDQGLWLAEYLILNRPGEKSMSNELKPIGVGIVGCGQISAKHADALQEIGTANLVAVSSRNEKKARDMANRYECAYYLNYQDMFQEGNIQLIIICTPNNTHAEIGIQAALAGKHVIVEKPIDASVQMAQKLINTCHDQGVSLTCIFQHRYDPAIQAAKAALLNGSLGKVTFGACYGKFYRPQSYYDATPGRGTFASDGGGALMMNGIHYIDSLIYLMGPVAEVFAYTATLAHEGIEVEDVATAVVRFKSGVIGTIEASTATFPGKMARMEICGNQGTIIIENDKVKDWRIMHDDMILAPFYGDLVNDQDFRDNGAIYNQSDLKSTFTQQIEGFIQSILAKQPPFITGESALHSLKVVLAIYESAKSHQPVRLDHMK